MEHQREQADCLRNGRRANWRDLFQTPNMRMKTLIISFSWYVAAAAAAIVNMHENQMKAEFIERVNSSVVYILTAK